jgi:alpha-tubulin suppressor-like RCC1 family protein
MSQTKVQLIAPIGVVTATTLETTGVLTATTFVGDIAGTVTGITSTTDNLNLGIVTATSFAGDFTGIGSGLTGTPNIVAGVVTATKFVGNTPGTVSGLADGTNINAGIITATSFVGNLTGNAAGLSTTTAQLTLGIVTATSYSGSGANLSGVSAGPVGQQAVTANSGTTTIDLSSGNVIYMTQSANTTVAFANTEGNTDVVYLVRVKDATATARTITWPSGFSWNGGTEPTLLNINDADEGQVFKLTTRDNGATWYGVEVYNNPAGFNLFSWGSNYSGMLGHNNNISRSSPTQVPGAGWSSIKAHNSANALFGVKTDGTLWGWGQGRFGSIYPYEIPGGYNTYNSSPVQIPGTTWKHASNAHSFSIGVKNDNTLWAWGYNAEYGAIGDNTIVSKSSPTQIPGTWATNVNSFGGSNNNSVAIKTDGTMWVWGSNHNSGNLGLNQATPVRISSPVQIPGTTWSQVIHCDHGTMALKTDGTIWGWGINDQGGLAQNNTNSGYSSPVQIGDKTNWASIGNGSRNKGAINTSGELWMWGFNEEGTLGQNSRTYYSSPVQVPGTNWAHLDIGAGLQGKMVQAFKTDGTLWAWGDGGQGQMGNNTNGNPAHYSSPVQIPGTTWSTTRQGIAVNNYSMYALKS